LNDGVDEWFYKYDYPVGLPSAANIMHLLGEGFSYFYFKNGNSYHKLATGMENEKWYNSFFYYLMH
jgi:hypothetical protein